MVYSFLCRTKSRHPHLSNQVYKVLKNPRLKIVPLEKYLLFFAYDTISMSRLLPTYFTSDAIKTYFLSSLC